jgi:hypothetical protein
MPKLQEREQAFSEIRVDPQPMGTRAVYLVETRSPEEAGNIDELFSELARRFQVRQLCSGKLLAYAVQTDEPDGSVLDEIEEILKHNCAFVVTQRSFDEVVYRIVRELGRDTGSKVIEAPHCNICGRPDPFPNVVVSLSDGNGSVPVLRNYCARCTAEAAAPSHKQFVRSLLAADECGFRKIRDAELIRHPTRGSPIRFQIRL